MDETPHTDEFTGPRLALPARWDWEVALAPPHRERLANALAKGIVGRRWFGSKARGIATLEIVEAVAVTAESRLILARIGFDTGPSEVYQIPLAFARGASAARLAKAQPAALWARVDEPGSDEPAVFYDPLGDVAFCHRLWDWFVGQESTAGSHGEITARQGAEFRTRAGVVSQSPPVRLLAAEQSNSSIVYGDRLILKLFRRIEQGINPDEELSEYLTAGGFRQSPPFAGAIDYRSAGQPTWALGILQGFVPNQGDAWQWMLGQLAAYAKSQDLTAVSLPRPSDSLCELARNALPESVSQPLAGLISSVQKLGRRTGELHQVLAADVSREAFKPESLTATTRREFCQAASDLARETLHMLRQQRARLSPDLQAQADLLLSAENTIHAACQQLADEPIEVSLIRTHGDYHLGQVLVTDDDFMIIDFEGEPARSLEERRRKKLALRDVAGMIRSLHYAGTTAAVQASHGQSGAAAARIQDHFAAWHHWISVEFLRAYRSTVGDAQFVPRSDQQFQRLLDACLLEKAIYELRYELNNRPDWIYLPLGALVQLASR